MAALYKLPPGSFPFNGQPLALLMHHCAMPHIHLATHLATALQIHLVTHLPA